MLKTQITAPQLFEKLQNIKLGASVCQYSLKKCGELVPLINEINDLKEEKNAVILAHSYISPEIIYGAADFVGDSYKLSRDALTTTASTIVFVAERLIGETAKILNPEKEVLEYPNAKVVSNPECNSAIIDNSDFVGSTEQMLGFMKETDSKQFLMLTECGLSARLQSEFPDKQLVGSCTMCKFMKSNSLE